MSAKASEEGCAEHDPRGGYWRGRQGSTWWFYFTGDCGDSTWDAYLEHCRNMLDSGERDCALICIAHHADSPTGAQRRKVAEFIEQEAARLRSLRGFALVVDSPLQVLALKAINWVLKNKPFEEQVFGAPSAGARWLAQRTATTPEEILHAIEVSVPRAHLWLD